MATVVTRTRLNALITPSSGTTLISLHVCTCLRLTGPQVDKKVKDENSHKKVARSDTYVPLFFPYLLAVIQYRGPASGKNARVPTWYCSVWRHTPVRATSRSRTLARSGHNVCSPLQRVVSPCVCVCVCLHKPFLTQQQSTEPERSSPTSQNCKRTQYTVSGTNIIGPAFTYATSLQRSSSWQCAHWWVVSTVLVEHVASIFRVFSTLILYQHVYSLVWHTSQCFPLNPNVFKRVRKIAKSKC